MLGAEAGCSTEQILSSVSTPPLSPQEEPPSGGSEPMAAGSTSVAAAAADRPAGVVTGEPQGQEGEAGSAAVVCTL